MYTICIKKEDKTLIRVYKQNENDEEWVQKEDDFLIDVFPITELRYDSFSMLPPLSDCATAQISWMNRRSEMQSFTKRLGLPIQVIHGLSTMLQRLKQQLKEDNNNICKNKADENKCLIKLLTSGGVGFAVPELENGHRKFLVEFIELQGSNYEFMERDLLKLEDYITNSFSRMVMSVKGNKSAEESKNETIGASSKLASDALALQAFLYEIHAKNCKITGVKAPTSKIIVNTSFLEEGISLDYLKALTQLDGTVLKKSGVVKELKGSGMLKFVGENDLIEDYS
jgi:hypothetical protein